MTVPPEAVGATDAVVRGVRLGVDVGMVRVGLAATDPDGLVATPVETLARDTAPLVPATGTPQAGDTTSQRRDQFVTSPAGRGTIESQGAVGQVPHDMSRIVAEARERSAQVVYVGLPRHLSGAEGEASAMAREYATALAGLLAPVPVRLVDERMTTVTAHQALRASGRAGRRHREVVDQVAAVVLLQAALDAERSRGVRAGALVAPAAQDGGVG